MMYPLKFTPIQKAKIWGGEKLSHFARHYSKDIKQVGETWDVSGIEGDESVVENGFLAGNSLNELVEVYMGDLVGEAVYDRFGNQFPLLVKLIDAQQNLSIQVHPNDELAQKVHNFPSGKTEMWCVLDAAPDAFLIAGFNRPVTKQEYVSLVASNTLESVLQKHPVKKGDIFFIPAGCVHAIGAGCVILEIQQTSDLTYRIYDYNRLENGKPRELHTDLAIEAIDFEHWENQKIQIHSSKNDVLKVVECDYFVANEIILDKSQEYDLAPINSFVLLSVIEGHLRCQYDDDYVTITDGETILIPAEMDSLLLVPTGEVRILETYIK